MHIKIFDCDIFIDLHKISVSDNDGQESVTCNKYIPLKPIVVKEAIESFFVPEKRLIEHPLPKDAIY